ncbi:MAG: NADH-quinone oxidoreductase subunit A [Actinomycetota bacterium]
MLLSGIALFTAGVGATRLFRPTAPSHGQLLTYECGIDPVEGGWAQSHVRYYRYAYLYVIFAVDAVYLLPWAAIVRAPQAGAAVIAEMGVFVAVLAVGLGYAWRQGALQWG